MSHDLSARAVIVPMLRRITIEHKVTAESFLPIVQDNPFVPEGREGIYALAINYGFQNEWIECLSILIPHVKHWNAIFGVAEE